MALPTFSKSIDNAFTQTWYDVRADAIDNIMLAIPVYGILKKRGCFKTQVGGSNIERTIRYALPTPVDITKGSVIPNIEVETRTAGFWTWRYRAIGIVRSLIDDQKNQGKYRISNYVTDRITEARDGLSQAFETTLYNPEVTDESGLVMQGLNDIVPSFDNKAAGTFGGIARANAYWQPKYLALNLPYEVNLETDLKKLHNNIWLNQERPNLIISDQNMYETYEEFALDATQIVKSVDTMEADLGYTDLYFKGMPWVWTPNHAANGVTMFNTNYIELVYDPTVWFEMTEWKTSPNMLERAAQIVSCCNMLSPQLRRHGRAYTNTSDG